MTDVHPDIEARQKRVSQFHWTARLRYEKGQDKNLSFSIQKLVKESPEWTEI